MKKTGIIILSAICIISLFAQDKIIIHKSDNSVVETLISAIDSMVFTNNGATINVYKSDNTVSNYAVSDIDSISFGSSSDVVSITYSNGSAVIVNPLADQGVTVTADGANVTVNSAIDGTEVSYLVSGSASDGSLKIYSSYRIDLILKGLTLTNTTGPAINIQSSKKISVTLAAGTTNTLGDGTTYATSTEDQKGTFFSEGQLIFSGTGSLNVSSIAKHGICSDDYIQVDGGNITVTAAGKDGIHCKDAFKVNSGTLNVTATSDGIDCEDGLINITGGDITTINSSADVKSISCDSTMSISGGTLNLTVNGNQSKGLKAKQRMTLSGGAITINTSGAAVLVAEGSGSEPSYCTAIKCDSAINMSGSSVTIISSGLAGKGISGDENVNITAGTISITTTGSGTTYKNSLGVTDSYAATCITADGNLNITGGNITTTSSGNGGKGLSADGSITIGDTGNSPALNIKTTGARFLVSGSDYCHPKAILATGAIVINNGTTIVNSTDDGIHSASSISVNGGNNTISAISTTQGMGEGVEAPTITFNGGTTNITASNDGINATYGTVAGGTEQNDGSNLYIKGGIVIVAGSDAIDSNGNITISGGTTIVSGPTNQPEEAIDYNGTFLVNGGLLIAGGSNSNMTTAMASGSTQVSMFIKSSASLAATSMLHIENASGTEMVTFKPKNAVYYFHFSSPALAKNTSYKFYFGGSYSGGSYVGNSSGWGLYTGGTYSTSGATLKSTTTTSSSGTVNTISF